MNKQERIITIVTVAVLLLAVLVFVLVWGAYSNWFKTDFEYIYLKSRERLQQDEVYTLGNVQLDVKQFGFKSGYTVNIYIAPDEDFVYTVNGVHKDFAIELSDQDVAEAFSIDLSKRSFVLHARQVELEDVLQCLYPEQDVKVVTILNKPVNYVLVVSSVSGEHTFELTFQPLVHVTDIEVDPDHVLA